MSLSSQKFFEALSLWPMDAEQHNFIKFSMDGASDDEFENLLARMEKARRSLRRFREGTAGATQDRTPYPKSSPQRMEFRPLRDHVVVRRIAAGVYGRIIIPDTAQEKPQEGEVMAVGPGRLDEGGRRVETQVAVGDHILFGRWSGVEVTIEGEEFLIMTEADVMGVIEGALPAVFRQKGAA